MTGRQDVFQQAMNQGHSAAWDQLWGRAAAFYRQALEEFPNNSQALTSLGLAMIELQDYDQALKCYEKAARVNREDPLPLEKVAQLYERMGSLDQASLAALRAAELYLKKRDINKAIENWERVTRLNPENLQAHSRLALVFERMGEKEKAVNAYIAVASLLQAGGHLEKAVSAASRALHVKPDSVEAAQALTLLKDFKSLPKPARPRGGTAPLRMSQVRKLETPEEIAQSDRGLDPVAQTRQKALTILAGMLFDSDDDEDDPREKRGLQAIVTGVGSGVIRKPVDNSRIVLHLSQMIDMQTRGEFVQAAEELQRALDFGLEHPAANFDLGFLYAQVGRLESAIRQLQNAARHQDFSLGSYLLLGDLQRKKGDLHRASLAYLTAIKLADLLVVPQDKADGLRQLYEPVFEVHRQQTDAEIQNQLCDNIEELLMRQDWREQLLRAREQLPAQAPGAPPMPLAEILSQASSSQVIDSLSHIYELANVGKPRSAMEEAFYALEKAPTYLPLHTFMGDLLVKQGDNAGAVAKYLVVAKIYGIRGETLQSINLFRKITELSPMDLNARGRLIEQLIAAGKSDDAINEYLRLADMYFNLADLNMARKTFTDALRFAQQAQVDRKTRVNILHKMADIDLQSLDWRQALRVFEQIRTLQPDDQVARANLIELNFRLGLEDRAVAELDNYVAYLDNKQGSLLSFLEQQVSEFADRVPTRRRLADMYLRMGRKQDAVTQYDAIGEILIGSGDQAGAIQIIEMILALDPPNKDEYKLLLEQMKLGT